MMRQLNAIFKRLSIVLLIFTLLITTLPLTAFSKANTTESSTATSKRLETYSTALANLPLPEQSSESSLAETKASQQKTTTTTSEEGQSAAADEKQATDETMREKELTDSSISTLTSKKTSETESTTSSTKSKATTKSSSEPQKKTKNSQSTEKTNQSTKDSTAANKAKEKTNDEATSELQAPIEHPEIQTSESQASEKQTTEETNTAVKSASRSSLTKAGGRDLQQVDGVTITVNDWEILDNAQNPLSETNPAQSNVGYTFNFKWTLAIADEATKLQAGDYFAFDLVKNVNDTGEGWKQVPVGSTPLTVTNNDDVDVIIGAWFTENGQVKLVFNENVKDLDVTQLNAVTFQFPANSLFNRNQAEKVMTTTFGGIDKQIKYEKYHMNYSNGYNFKRARTFSNLAAEWEMTVNLGALLELNGDEVNFRDNPQWGFYHDPNNQKHQWGEYSTGIRDENNDQGALLYVEDQLDPGVTIRNLTIQPDIRIPMNLPNGAQAAKKGGQPSDVHAYDQLILAHSNTDGPLYRKGATDTSNNPSEEDSLKQLIQKNNETKEAFRKRVRATPGTYGIYVEGTGKDAVRTVMVNFGRVDPGSKNDAKTYEELLNGKKQTSSVDRTITDRNGSPVAVPEFAKRAAQRAIGNGYYEEADRELLEDYFTLVYGDSNVLGGRIPSYMIWLDTDYPPETPSGTKRNTIDHYYRYSLSYDDSEVPRSLSTTGTLTNPLVSLTVNATEAVLFKWNEEDNSKEMNGFNFKLQKKINGSWTDVAGKDNLVTSPNTIGSLSYPGTIRVTGLEDGATYRFVETASPYEYDPTLSSDYDATEKAVISKEFTIRVTNSNGAIVHVRNKKAKMANYRVEHWLLEDGKDVSTKDNFRLANNDEFSGRVGDTLDSNVYPHIRSYTDYKYAESLPYNVKTAIVKEDSTTVLKRYYIKDDGSEPKYPYKVEHYLQKRGQGGADPKEKDFYLKDTEYKSGLKGETVSASTKNYPAYTHKVIAGLSKLDGVVTEDGQLTLKLYYVFEESIEMPAVFYKIDENKNIMPSVDENGTQLKNDKGEDLKVTFSLVGWTWKSGAPPINETPPTPANIAAGYWKVRASNLATDNEGKIDISQYLDKGTANYSGAYALIETATYPDHQLTSPKETEAPQEGQVYYFFWGGATGGVGWTDVFQYSDGVWARKTDWATYSKYVDNEFRGDNLAIKNFAKSGDLNVYKANEKNELMVPDGTNNVKFKLYAWNQATGVPDINTGPTKDSSKWTQVGGEYTVDSNGQIIGLDRSGIPEMAKYYALVETETHTDYDLPASDAYWLVTTKTSTDLSLGYRKVIDTVKYIGPAGSDPGLLLPTDNENPTYDANKKSGYYTIKNKKTFVPESKMDFYFVKEGSENADGGNERLENVEFKLYKKNNDATPKPNPYPNNPDGTYWDLANPLHVVTSDNFGRVRFKDLAAGEYLLVETKAAPNYQLPSGYWVVQLDPTQEGYLNQVEITGHGDPLPPAFRKSSGNLYLQNFPAYQMPRAGGRLTLFLTVLGIVMIGLASMVDFKKKVS